MNVLAIGAHFDDIELGCGGTIARHVDVGDRVFAYVATLSGYKNPKGEEIRSNEVAKEEGLKALSILGAEPILGQFNTMEIEFTDDLNCEILSIIEEQKIDIVYTHWDGDIHHDHQVVSKASLHCTRHVPRVLTYKSNWYISQRQFKENFYVDISKYYDKKTEAIKCHVSEVNRTMNRWLEYIESYSKIAGLKVGVSYAEGFEVVKWLL